MALCNLLPAPEEPENGRRREVAHGMPVAHHVLELSDRMFDISASQTGWRAKLRDALAPLVIGPASQLDRVQTLAFRALSQGEQATDTFTVTVSDEHGASTTQDVVITIHGANDAAVITGTSTADLTETNAVLTASGTPDKPIVIKAAGDGEVVFDGDTPSLLADPELLQKHLGV